MRSRGETQALYAYARIYGRVHVITIPSGKLHLARCRIDTCKYVYIRGYIHTCIHTYIHRYMHTYIHLIAQLALRCESAYALKNFPTSISLADDRARNNFIRRTKGRTRSGGRRGGGGWGGRQRWLYGRGGRGEGGGGGGGGDDGGGCCEGGVRGSEDKEKEEAKRRGERHCYSIIFNNGEKRRPACHYVTR